MGLYGIILKEFKHITRDFRTLLILFCLPLIMMVLFGYAMTLEVNSIHLIIEDQDHSQLSRDLTRDFRGSSFFQLETTTYSSHKEIFLHRDATAVLTIPEGFEADSLTGRQPRLNLDIDASNSNRAVVIRQYMESIILRFARSRGENPSPVTAVPAFLYNRELTSSYFFVPALTALLIIMVSALLTSLTITREKEQGTFDQIKLSPVHAWEIILGKVVPYLVLSLLIAGLIVLSGNLFFNVPVRGSLLSLGFYILLYCLTGLSFGMLISTITSSQQAAMLIALIGTLLPTLFLSGFIFPLEAMPRVLRVISYAIPARYFLIIIRGLMLKGNTQADLLFQIGMLAFFSLFFLTVSIRRFKHYLET